ncbi:helix-turn-helix domain-containing protein [Zunongwangia sp. SCSIO 43204]|uniref:IS66 family insertion sequence element accessory protein TnpA n=1 Tax=Zunongwangia sp. SCSIO 43204 TaxID=2779359 RepID=UPI001CAA1D76|nr:helix-turn-helix domain-containing protein [Zunongwangia sp. SCSIO 43204]UAB85905.1 helix-turn-helix domain-containing protein [Zunongwangia sp. SCSIO 43204]
MTRSSTSEMCKLVTSYYESGQSQTAFARAHGISKGKLSYWVNKFIKEKGKKQAKSNFVSLSADPSTAPTSSRSMHIRLGNGVEIEIPL